MAHDHIWVHETGRDNNETLYMHTRRWWCDYILLDNEYNIVVNDFGVTTIIL